MISKTASFVAGALSDLRICYISQRALILISVLIISVTSISGGIIGGIIGRFKVF